VLLEDAWLHAALGALAEATRGVHVEAWAQTGLVARRQLSAGTRQRTHSKRITAPLEDGSWTTPLRDRSRTLLRTAGRGFRPGRLCHMPRSPPAFGADGADERHRDDLACGRRCASRSGPPASVPEPTPARRCSRPSATLPPSWDSSPTLPDRSADVDVPEGVVVDVEDMQFDPSRT